MKLELPTKLGPFSIDGQGRIAPRPGGEAPHFRFRWRDRRISARLEGAGRLRLSAWLGRVPSSAGNVPVAEAADRRGASFAALRELPDLLPADWRVRLMPDHQVRLDAERGLAWPASAVELTAELARFLLALAPYLDLLEEGAVLEPASAGMTRT